MFKQLSIAVVCGLALYGLTKLISQQITVVANGPGQTPDPCDSSPGLPENATSPDEVGQPDAQDPTTLPAEHFSDTTQAAPCP